MRFAAMFVALLLAPHAWAEDLCADCRSTATVDTARCVQSVVTPTEGEMCNAKFEAAMRACQEVFCQAELAAKMAAMCPDCLKDAATEAKKCEALRPASGEREACEKKAAGMKRLCEEKFCGLPGVKRVP
jgi:Skp family chaperone for outer membrane proteins